MSHRNKDEVGFSINQVAKEIGVVPATIRNWEKHGLFSARRAENGYRFYTLSDVERLRAIKQYSKDDNMGIKALQVFFDARSESIAMKQINNTSEVSMQTLSQKWKDYRVSHGYLLEEVAAAIGVSASYMSKIENGLANASLSLMQKLAEFYGENILYYVEVGEDDKHLIRKNEGELISIGVDGVQVKAVVALKKHTLMVMIYTIEAGSGRVKASVHNGEEFVHVLAGRVRITLDEQQYDMKPGDSLHFLSTSAHSWSNTGNSTARLLWVYTPVVQV